MVPGNYNENQIEQWFIRIGDRLNRGLAPDAKSSWTIDRVPSKWRGVHNTAFNPENIRIGPFKLWERSSPQLQVMEEHKTRFLIRLLKGWRSDGNMSRNEGERLSDDRGKNDNGGRLTEDPRFKELEKAMELLEKDTKAFYSESSDFQNPTMYAAYPRMMVMDGCFVIELLRLYYDLCHTKSTVVAIEPEVDPIFTNPRILATLRRDLLLLENQLPFFVLDKLYELINKNNNIDLQQAVPLQVLAVTFFEPLLHGHDAASKLDIEKQETKCLLEVVHSTFLQSVSEKIHKKGSNPVKSRSKPKGSTTGPVLHFASELEEAGVQFKKRKGHSLLDIEFGRRTLRVPPLSLDEHTISLLLNCVAYELTVDHPQPIFSNYLMFWNSLVNCPGDVQILHNRGIINNALGSNMDVAKLLIKCREVIYDRDLGYLYDDFKKVNEYCAQYNESICRVWWRSLIRERFSSPWTCLSLFAAIILLLLTTLQTIYTVFPYYRPH